MTFVSRLFSSFFHSSQIIAYFDNWPGPRKKQSFAKVAAEFAIPENKNGILQ